MCIFLGFTVGATYAMSIVFPFTIAALAMGVLVAHETGHYYSASLRGGNPDVPIIVPLGIGAIGITRVRNLPHLSARAKRYIITAGPIAGALTAISLLPFAILFGGNLIVMTACGILAMEVYGGTFGSDGKKWRREQRNDELAR